MKAHTPEISWHNRLPTLALDIAPPNPEINEVNTYKVATGGNDCRVYIWSVNTITQEISIRAGLRRHQRSVGAVRFSTQHVLASGDDDGYIYLWKQRNEEEQQQHQAADSANSFLNDDGFEDIESWQHLRVLRGHIEDVCDLTWSKDGKYLLSGSIDNSAILWDTTKGTKIWCSDLIKGYVQGVAIDPHMEYMVALSSDRTLRTYSFAEKKLLYATRRMNIKKDYKAFFCDDTVQTFCRRLEFSPDGLYFVAPTSRMVKKETQQAAATTIEEDEEEKEVEKTTTQLPPPKPTNILLVFKRDCLKKPDIYYQIGKEVALCVRFSPITYELNKTNEENLWKLPYRFLFAVATSRSLIIYDTQQSTPIGYVSRTHLARLTDLAWSHDGTTILLSSYDGYITLVSMEPGELGQVYQGEFLKIESRTEKIEKAKMEKMEKIEKAKMERMEKLERAKMERLEKIERAKQEKLERMEKARLEKERIEKEKLEKAEEAKAKNSKPTGMIEIRRYLIKRS